MFQPPPHGPATRPPDPGALGVRDRAEEQVRLTWAEGGGAKDPVATPGQHFLDRFGNFPRNAEVQENGRATGGLVSGGLTEVTAERITYSAETAHLFEQVQVADATLIELRAA